jgi:type II secretion system protein I
LIGRSISQANFLKLDLLSYGEGFSPLHSECPIFQDEDEGRINDILQRMPRLSGWGVTGFTLLEVLVSLSILSIGLIAIIGAVVNVLRVNRHVYYHSVGLLLADEMLNRLEAGENLPEEKVEKRFGKDYQWKIDKKYEPQSKLYSTRMYVNWQERDKCYQIVLSTSIPIQK